MKTSIVEKIYNVKFRLLALIIICIFEFTRFGKELLINLLFIQMPILVEKLNPFYEPSLLQSKTILAFGIINLLLKVAILIIFITIIIKTVKRKK